MIYLDYNATTPCDPEVVKAMLPYFNEKFGNAASKTHPYGWTADEAVKTARKQIASLIHADESEIIFTSGSTEGCNLAIKGVAERYITKGNHIITSKTEHKAVLDTCKHLEEQGIQVTYLNVDGNGLIDLKQLEAAIRPETILIALMYANNETGVIQPIKEAGTIAKKHNILFFSDATQAIGKVDVNVMDDNIDILTMSSHKFYGPKGIGAIYIRRKGPRVSIAAQIDGGGHERGFRSGTLNVPGIVGMGKAAELCNAAWAEEYKRCKGLRNRLEEELETVGIKINSSDAERLPNVSNLRFNGIAAEKLLSKTNGALAYSLGSACTSAHKEPSHVLQAMGLDDVYIKESIRISIGRFTSEKDIDLTIAILTEATATIKVSSQSFIGK